MKNANYDLTGDSIFQFHASHTGVEQGTKTKVSDTNATEQIKFGRQGSLRTIDHVTAMSLLASRTWNAQAHTNTSAYLGSPQTTLASMCPGMCTL